MNDIVQIARNLNKTFGTVHTTLCNERMVELLQFVQQKGSLILIDLKNRVDLQCVGIAFCHIALYSDSDGSKKYNESAAIYAYYCLSKSFISHNDTTELPTLFTLLSKKPELLLSSFLSYSCKAIEQKTGKSIATSIEKRISQLPSFNKQIYDYIEYTAYFTASFFFDLENGIYTNSTSNSAFRPTKSELYNHITPLYNRYNQTWLLKEGYRYFEGVFRECITKIENVKSKE